MITKEKKRSQDLVDLQAQTRRLETELRLLEEEKQRKKIVEEAAKAKPREVIEEDRPL